MQEFILESLDLTAFAQIVWLDLVLSADNAVVIGMVAHQLAPAHKRIAIVGGALFAIVARIGTTFLVASAIRLPGLQLFAGVLLIVVAVKLLRDEEVRRSNLYRARNQSVLHAMLAIALADLIMSLDNVLAVAALSSGDLRLLVFGLVLSISLIMTCGMMVATLMDRFTWLAYLGACFLAWIAGRLIAEDCLLEDWTGGAAWVSWLISTILTLAVLGLAKVREHMFRRSNQKHKIADRKGENEVMRQECSITPKK